MTLNAAGGDAIRATGSVTADAAIASRARWLAIDLALLALTLRFDSTCWGGPSCVESAEASLIGEASCSPVQLDDIIECDPLLSDRSDECAAVDTTEVPLGLLPDEAVDFSQKELVDVEVGGVSEQLVGLGDSFHVVKSSREGEIALFCDCAGEIVLHAVERGDGVVRVVVQDAP
jgi:hypothetical protein